MEQVDGIDSAAMKFEVFVAKSACVSNLNICSAFSGSNNPELLFRLIIIITRRRGGRNLGYIYDRNCPWVSSFFVAAGLQQ